MEGRSRRSQFTPSLLALWSLPVNRNAGQQDCGRGLRRMRPYRTELVIMERTKGQKLALFDTLSRKVRPITARDGKSIRIYCCGPTVYRDAHVGNLRTFLLADLVSRTLRFQGHHVIIVQNITDVGHMSDDFDEDKMLAASTKEKRDPFAIARDYEDRFHRDCRALNIESCNLYPRASECIELMVEHIQQLFDRELAYLGDDGSVYFAAEKFPSYGELSGNRLDALRPGHRYDYSEGGAKRFHADWALWKAAGSRTQMIWETPWGKGFPGWHIECSAMSLKFLDGHIDLHIGGIDLRFPHHENERAQSNPVTGDEAVSAWLHGEHLLFEGRKMSKSSGNVVLVSDVIARGFDPLAIRFCFMENNYRSQMDLSWAGISAAHSLLKRWREKYQIWRTSAAEETSATSEIIDEISQAFSDDLNTPQAMIALRAVEKEATLSDGERRQIFETLDPLLGLNLCAEVIRTTLSQEAESLLAKREEARKARDFEESDRLRNQLAALGIDVRDTATGQVWERA